MILSPQITCLILLLSTLSSSFSYASSFEEFDDLVHMVKVKSSKKSAVNGRGTGFVVNKDGYLITNYHVIAGMFKKGKVNKNYNIYVTVDKKEYQATVVRIDIINDLALLKIPFSFSQQVSITNQPVTKGEKIYSLGYHDKNFLAINQGTFSDYLKETENELMAISTPLNPGMSGGPIVNSKFEVVGVNVLKNSSNESDGYGINAQKLKEFLAIPYEAKNHHLLETILDMQIEQTYGRIVASIQDTKKSNFLNHWKLADMEHILRCREFMREHNLNRDKDDKDKDQITVKNKICSLDYRKVPLSALGTDIRFNYLMGHVQGAENTKDITYYNFLNKRFKFQDYKNIFSRHRNGEYACRKNVVENKYGVKFRLSICLKKHSTVPAYIKEDNYYIYTVKAVTLSKERDDLILQLDFSGTKALAKNLIKMIVDSVEKTQKERDIASE